MTSAARAWGGITLPPSREPGLGGVKLSDCLPLGIRNPPAEGRIRVPFPAFPPGIRSVTMTFSLRHTGATAMAGKYDAIIIGAGHNGLVTACYLVRAGWKVLVLERRYVVGGACVTEEAFPGFKVSTAAYVNSLFRKEIVRDLRLHEHGFTLLERN